MINDVLFILPHFSLQDLGIYQDEITGDDYVPSDPEDNLDWHNGMRRWVNR